MQLIEENNPPSAPDQIRKTMEKEKEIQVLFTAKCYHSHEEGLTKGNDYNVVGESEKYYDIYPDNFGHLSGFDKRFFQELQIK